MVKKTLAIDFDGTIHRYSKGWYDGTCYDEPMPGAIDALLNFMNRGYDVIIFTARPVEPVREWMKKYWTAPMFPIPDVTNVKPIAIAYIDDRAVTFKGDWNEMLELFPWRTK